MIVNLICEIGQTDIKHKNCSVFNTSRAAAAAAAAPLSLLITVQRYIRHFRLKSDLQFRFQPQSALEITLLHSFTTVRHMENVCYYLKKMFHDIPTGIRFRTKMPPSSSAFFARNNFRIISAFKHKWQVASFFLKWSSCESRLRTLC